MCRHTLGSETPAANLGEGQTGSRTSSPCRCSQLSSAGWLVQVFPESAELAPGGSTTFRVAFRPCREAAHFCQTLQVGLCGWAWPVHVVVIIVLVMPPAAALPCPSNFFPFRTAPLLAGICCPPTPCPLPTALPCPQVVAFVKSMRNFRLYEADQLVPPWTLPVTVGGRLVAIHVKLWLREGSLLHPYW
jgi:hypothetical protein